MNLKVIFIISLILSFFNLSSFAILNLGQKVDCEMHLKNGEIIEGVISIPYPNSQNIKINKQKYKNKEIDYLLVSNKKSDQKYKFKNLYISKYKTNKTWKPLYNVWAVEMIHGPASEYYTADSYTLSESGKILFIYKTSCNIYGLKEGDEYARELSYKLAPDAQRFRNLANFTRDACTDFFGDNKDVLEKIQNNKYKFRDIDELFIDYNKDYILHTDDGEYISSSSKVENMPKAKKIEPNSINVDEANNEETSSKKVFKKDNEAIENDEKEMGTKPRKVFKKVKEVKENEENEVETKPRKDFKKEKEAIDSDVKESKVKRKGKKSEREIDELDDDGKALNHKNEKKDYEKKESKNKDEKYSVKLNENKSAKKANTTKDNDAKYKIDLKENEAKTKVKIKETKPTNLQPSIKSESNIAY